MTRTGSSDTSFLYGTLHSRDARAFNLQDSTLFHLDRCDLFAGELEIEGLKRMSAARATAFLLPEGRSLDAFYSKRECKLVSAALKERLGPLAPMCTRLRPFHIIAMLTEMDMRGDSSVVLDAWLQAYAAQHGMEVIGLETVDEQLAALDRISLNDQARMLLEVVREDDTHGPITAALDAYAAHDLDALMVLLDRDDMPALADKALLLERNVRMVARLDARMREGRQVFGAVGAAHLPGEHGILQLLRNEGYVVMPVGRVADR